MISVMLSRQRAQGTHVKLTIGMRLKAHVYGGHLGGNRKNSSILLTSPTSIVLAKLVVRKSVYELE